MISFSTDDLRTPESLERVLRQFVTAMQQPIRIPQVPTLGQIVDQLTPIIRSQLQAGGSFPLNLQSLLPTSLTSLTIPNALSTTLPMGLGAPDQGFLVWVTDYSHLLQWTGSAWTWGPADPGSGFYAMYESAPSGFGANAWQVCDGSTVNRFNADGTTTSVTVPDVTTAVYLKASLAAAAIAAASGNVFTGTAGTTSSEGAAATTVDNTLAGSTVAVAAHPHTHAFTPAGSNSAVELRNKQVAMYYRR